MHGLISVIVRNGIANGINGFMPPINADMTQITGFGWLGLLGKEYHEIESDFTIPLALPYRPLHSLGPTC